MLKKIKEQLEKCKDCNGGSDCKCGKGGNMGNANTVYGMGFIGAVIYFLSHATTFGAGVFGILKAIVWPAILVFKALELLQF